MSSALFVIHLILYLTVREKIILRKIMLPISYVDRHKVFFT